MRTLAVLLFAISAACGGQSGADMMMQDASSPPQASLFVATNGNDAWSGTLAAPNAAGTDGPLLTLDGARKAAAQYKQAHPGDVTVMFRAGTYFLDAPVSFGASDSGTSGQEIIYTSYPGETPVVSGGKLVTGWTQGAASQWTASIDPTSFQYFEQLFVNGVRRFRPTTSPGAYLYNAGPVEVAAQTPTCSVLDSATGQYECFDRFMFSNTDMNPSWHNLADIVIDDFENWTMTKLWVKSIDATAHIAYLSGSTTMNASFGFLIGHRYLVENAPDALSQPGQFYLDRLTTPTQWKLTYLADSSDGAIDQAEVIAPEQTQLVVATGLAYVTFRGLTFSHASWTIPSTGANPGYRGVQAAPDIAAALSFTTSTHITIDSCIIDHSGGWGLELEGASTNNTVENSELTDLGAGGIRIGQLARASDTDASVPSMNVVQNTIVTGTGRINPDGGGVAIWLGNAHHNTVTHNEVYDSYGGGLGVNVPSGNPATLSHDNAISFNLVHDINEGTMRDGGAIYLAIGTATGNQVLNNVVHDVSADTTAGSYGGWWIYLDNGSSNITVRNNLVYRLGASPGFNHDGINNLWDNNILAYGRLAEIQDGSEYTALASAPSLTFSHNIVIFDKAEVQAKNPWACFGNCPAAFDFKSNLYSEIGGTPSFVTTDANNENKVSYTLAAWQALGEDVGSMLATPCQAAPSSDDYSACTAATAATAIGFVSFDPTQAGRTTPVLMPPAAPAGFPLQLLNPATDY